jgi:hypothetical protein
MFRGTRNGNVVYIPTIQSISMPCFSTSSTACSQVVSELAKSPDKLSGRRMARLAGYLQEII